MSLNGESVIVLLFCTFKSLQRFQKLLQRFSVNVLSVERYTLIVTIKKSKSYNNWDIILLVLVSKLTS
jgi:hypothetical protein